MAIVVEHPLGTFEFPDDYNAEQINQKIIEAEAQYGEQYGIYDTLHRSVERGFTSTARGIEEFITGDIGDGIGTEGTDAEREYEYRKMLAQNPGTAIAGTIGGSILDPITAPLAFLKLFKIGGTLATGALRGGIAGASGGATEPVYDEYGDSAALNIMLGTGVGSLLGGAAGKFFPKALTDDVQQAIEDAEAAARKAELDTELERTNMMDMLNARTVDTAVAEKATQTQAQPLRGVEATARLEDELYAKGADGYLPDSQVKVIKAKQAKAQADLATEEAKLVKVQKALARVKKPGPQQIAKARVEAQQTNVNKAKAILDEHTARLTKNAEARRAGTQYDKLTKGQPLNKANQARLQQYKLAEPKLTPVEAMPAPKLEPVVPQKPTVQFKVAEDSMTPLQDSIMRPLSDSGSIGAMRTSPIQLRGDRAFTPKETARFDEAEGLRLQRDRKGRATTRGAPEASLPPALQEMAGKAYASVNSLRYGAATAMGRGATRGSGSYAAMAGGAARTRKQIEEAGDSVYDYIINKPDLTASEVVMAAPIRKEILERLAVLQDDYDNFITKYKTFDKVPADEQRKFLNELLPSLLFHRKLSGEGTKAADKLNAMKIVKNALRRDERIKELFGTRCY
jgi:hypothetical protein